MNVTHDNANLRHILLEARLVSAPKGEIIHRTDEGAKLFMLSSGYVKRYLVKNDGSLSIQGIYGPGDIFPLTAMYKLLLDQTIYSGPEIYYYETICSSKFYLIDENEFLRMIENDPKLYKDLFALAGRRLRSNIQQIENVSMRNANARVAHQLLYYAQFFGIKKKQGTQITIPLTHEMLASVLDLARETVSQSISLLREEKLIKTTKNIVVIDMEKLAKAAYS